VPLSASLKFAAEDREVRNSDRQLLAVLCRYRVKGLLVKSDAIGGQAQRNFAPDNQTGNAHAKTPSCATAQEGVFSLRPISL
jgi:hypothetical protein